MSTFAVDVSKWVKKATGNVDAFLSEFGQEMARAVVEATPVDTGFLRGSWYARLDGKVSSSGGLDGSVVAEMHLTISKFKAGQTLYILNGCSYGWFVEYGTSTMAPRAYVRGTLAQAPAIAARVAARIAKR